MIPETPTRLSNRYKKENLMLRDWIFTNLDKSAWKNTFVFRGTKEAILYTNYGSLRIRRPPK